MTKINIIGAGNVGHYFAKTLSNAGHQVLCIYNRTISRANELASKCGSIATDDLIALPIADLNIVAISDDYISSISSQIGSLHGYDTPIVHTSGTLGLDAISKDFTQKGCIWPLQSITMNENFDEKTVPLCIDANTDTFSSSLMGISKSISSVVEHLPSSKKKHAHIAAVISNNFSNHLFTLAEKYCNEHDIEFDLLKPLIIESVLKIKRESPYQIQTGPARRGDLKTIEKHLKLLKDKNTKKIYKRISKSIIKTYHENN